MSNLLVELGVEELPTDALNVIYSELKPKMAEALKKARLESSQIQVEATPRRIALYIEGLPARQGDETLEISGPSYEKAYGADGSPTPALTGFLNSKGAKLEQVSVKETPRGKFVVIQQKNIGKPVSRVLPDLLKAALNSLVFPKTMRWGKTGFRFPRPVRWLVALLDKKVIKFEFLGLKASNKTYGHRFLSAWIPASAGMTTRGGVIPRLDRGIHIPSADWALYKKMLRKAHVVLELEERKKLIAKGLQTQFKQKSYDEELLHTTANLVEEPFLLRGSFAKEYLELPKEVLASCMKKNQKIFACCDSNSKLTGKFVAVLNGKRTGLNAIRNGYENVLESRLKDARYFYKADTKEPLEKKRPLLEQVAYLGKLGNMLQKTQRLEKLAEKWPEIASSAFGLLAMTVESKEEGGSPPGVIARPKAEAISDLKRAAHLSKIDLITHMVYEFPDLQGIIGREYALACGEKKEVALAIGTQYLPQNLSEDFLVLRKTFNELGALFGIMDRLDLLVGAFGTGIVPTGSQDPFALRRAGGALVKILRAFPFHFSLRKAIETNASLYGKVGTLSLNELTEKLMKFFEERLVFELQVKTGTREYEILQAVTRASFDDLADVYERYERLRDLYRKEPQAFIKTAKVIERTANITKGMKGTSPVNPELLTEISEKKLYEVLEQSAPELKGFVRDRHYEKATVRFGESFYKPLHDFFEQVMVNVEDTKIRANRQALMRQINALYSEKVADLSVLSRLDQA